MAISKKLVPTITHNPNLGLTKPIYLSAAVFIASLIGACASTPAGPTVQVLPGAFKSYEQFQEEKAFCMQNAQSQTATQVSATNTHTGETAAIGTVVGAALGAVVGNSTGAGVGAGLGAAAGTYVGNNGMNPQTGTQEHYNRVYVQCMVAKGNKVN